jgi:hypothetical protein
MLTGHIAEATEKTFSCSGDPRCARLLAGMNYFVTHCGGRLTPDPRAQFAGLLIGNSTYSMVDYYKSQYDDAERKYGRDGLCKTLGTTFAN